MRAMTRTSEIRLAVHSGADGVTDIRWEADDAPEPGEQAADAMILALWDGERRNAMRIDLWTPRLTVDDMNDFVYQTLLSLGDSYHRATGNDDLMAEIKGFARVFAERASGAEQRAAAKRQGATQPQAAAQRRTTAER
jgi:gliding motility-associated protein GldC